jgi:predicted P-loop ATPase/GTPase
MASWKDYKPENLEWDNMLKVLNREVMASGQLEEILSSSRSKNRKHYSIFHRRLELSVL